MKLTGVYPGVDLVYYGSEGRLEYDFVVAPHADPNRIRFRVDGASLRTAGDGSLVAETPAGPLRFKAPVAYQQDSRRRPVASRYVLDGDDSVRFALGDYDRSRRLVIDPVLMFSTLLGGADADIPGSLAVDSSGAPYLAGVTYSRNFPTAGINEPNFSRNLQGLYDGYVAKLRADGTALAYSTYIGGDLLDIINCIAVDSRGAAYISGQTASYNFPLPATAFSRNRQGFSDAYILKLNPDGTLAWATLLGGAGDENGTGILVDSSFNTYLTGYTSSPNFPTTPNAAQRTYGGGASDSFALKIDPAGQVLIFSTYVGGRGEEEVSRIPTSDLPQLGFISSFAIARNAQGAVWLAGSTSTADLGEKAETAGRAYAGGATDIYLIRLSADGSKFEFITYLGGNAFDFLYALDLDTRGNPHVTGLTLSQNFPTTQNALHPRYLGGGSDGFLTRFQADNGSVNYSTFWGGQGEDSTGDLVVASNGDVYFAGSSNSRDFVVTSDAFDPGPPRGSRPFLAAVNAAGNGRLTSGFFGGPDAFSIRNVRLDGDGNILISGHASGPGFTTTLNASDPTFNGGAYDAFVAKFARLGAPGGPATPPVGGVCAYTLDPGILDLPGDPLVASVTVLTGPECAWTTSGNLPWVTILGARDRRGPGVVYVSVSANQDSARAGTIQIAGRDVTVRQARRDSGAGRTLTPVVTTVAGSGRRGVQGDDGPAARAEFAAVSGIAIDTRGSIFVADPETHVIRRVRPDGIIQAFAGIGTNGFSGDGGPAIRARMNEPAGMAVDAAGNLYFADRANRRIRRIAADGNITTIAGNGQAGSDGDDGPALQASFREPSQLIFDTAGNLYVSDAAANRIRRITPAGIITTYAGTGQPGFSGDDGPAAAARLTSPAGMAFDRQGNFYFADQLNHRIRRIDTRGVIRTVAGTGVAAWEGDNRPAVGAAFNSPFGLAFDNAGTLYVTDRENHRIRAIDAQGTITTFAGRGLGAFFGEDAPPAQTSWSFPSAITADAAGNLIVADPGNLRVRRIQFPLPPPPQTAIRAVLNTFSSQAVISGFSLASLFGENFVGASLTWDSAIVDGNLPVELGGIRVRINNRDAYVSFVSPGQINVLVPLDLTTGPVPVEVSGPNGRGAAQVFLSDVAPGLLTLRTGEQTSPLAQFADENVLVAPAGAIPERESRPAKAGDTVDLTATGLGLTDPIPPQGQVFTASYPLADLSRISVTIGGKPAAVVSAAMVSPGTFVVRVQIPEEAGSGFVPVQLQVRGVSAQSGLVLAVE